VPRDGATEALGEMTVSSSLRRRRQWHLSKPMPRSAIIADTQSLEIGFDMHHYG
jgi:hypothetical protein